MTSPYHDLHLGDNHDNPDLGQYSNLKYNNFIHEIRPVSSKTALVVRAGNSRSKVKRLAMVIREQNSGAWFLKAEIKKSGQSLGNWKIVSNRRGGDNTTFDAYVDTEEQAERLLTIMAKEFYA